tara:strand:- start:171 stop:1136 length:966 start_codon:yes stop_codon:yes gene_type:complete
LTKIGVIANPSAGKDIRRLVASGRIISNQEKANIISRFITGLISKGIRDFYFMPDKSGLCKPAIENYRDKININFLDTKFYDGPEQTLIAASLLNDIKCDCVLVLGGDGTNRLVAKKINQIPLIPLSTGTNNAFPLMIDPTIAGIAAGFFVNLRRGKKKYLIRNPYINVKVDENEKDIALIDLAISKQNFVGSKAIWDPEMLEELFLTKSSPLTIGLSSIGSRVLSANKNKGMRIIFGEQGKVIYAPIAPGLISTLKVKKWSLMNPDEIIKIENFSGTIALDGEREIEIFGNNKIEISYKKSGPYIIDIIKSIKQDNLSQN